MAISTTQNKIGFITMDDGTKYDINVTYHNDKGEAVSCNLGSSISAETQKELESLIKTMAIAHARKALKSFKDLPIIHLDNLGATFPNQSVQSHELPLEDIEKDSLPREDQAFTKINQLWEKTSQLLVSQYNNTIEDYIEIPVSSNKDKEMTTSIDLTVEPSAPTEELVNVSETPPPSYSTNPPSPTSLSGKEEDKIDEETQCDNLSEKSRCSQSSHIAANTIDQKPSWYNALRHPLTTLQKKLCPQPSPINLGALPEDFDFTSLKQEKDSIVQTYLTLPSKAEPPKTEKQSMFSRSKQPAPETPSKDLSLPAFKDQEELPAVLDTFIENAIKQSAPHGFGAILDIINTSCSMLTKALPESGAEDYASQIEAHFKQYLNKMVIAEVNKNRENKALAEAIWEAFNNEERNGLKNRGITLTKASLGLL